MCKKININSKIFEDIHRSFLEDLKVLKVKWEIFAFCTHGHKVRRKTLKVFKLENCHNLQLRIIRGSLTSGNKDESTDMTLQSLVASLFWMIKSKEVFPE